MPAHLLVNAAVLNFCEDWKGFLSHFCATNLVHLLEPLRLNLDFLQCNEYPKVLWPHANLPMQPLGFHFEFLQSGRRSWCPTMDIKLHLQKPLDFLVKLFLNEETQYLNLNLEITRRGHTLQPRRVISPYPNSFHPVFAQRCGITETDIDRSRSISLVFLGYSWCNSRSRLRRVLPF